MISEGREDGMDIEDLKRDFREEYGDSYEPKSEDEKSIDTVRVKRRNPGLRSPLSLPRMRRRRRPLNQQQNILIQ